MPVFDTLDDFWHEVERGAYRLLMLRAAQLDNALTVTDPSGGGGRLADRDTIQAMAEQLVDRLRSDDEETRRRATMIVGVAGDELGRVPLRFHGSPLGQACLLAIPTADVAGLGMTMDEAGALLGVTRQAVADLLKRGKLTRLNGPEQGVVDRASVQARLASRLPAG